MTDVYNCCCKTSPRIPFRYTTAHTTLSLRNLRARIFFSSLSDFKRRPPVINVMIFRRKFLVYSFFLIFAPFIYYLTLVIFSFPVCADCLCPSKILCVCCIWGLDRQFRKPTYDGKVSREQIELNELDEKS